MNSSRQNFFHHSPSYWSKVPLDELTQIPEGRQEEERKIQVISAQLNEGQGSTVGCLWEGPVPKPPSWGNTERRGLPAGVRGHTIGSCCPFPPSLLSSLLLPPSLIPSLLSLLPQVCIMVFVTHLFSRSSRLQKDFIS